MPLKQTEDYYLLVVYGDVEPELSNKLKSYDSVLRKARKHRRENGTDDGLYIIAATAGANVSIDAFCGGDFN